MKAFSLEEYLKNPNKKLVTRDGRSARIVCVDAKGDYPVVAMVLSLDGTLETPHNYTKNGHFDNNAYEYTYDLFFSTEKHEGWFNIYHCDDLGFYIRQNQPYKSKEEADEVAKANFRTFFATVKVEWEE